MAKIQGTTPVTSLQERKIYLQQIITVSQEAMYHMSSSRKKNTKGHFKLVNKLTNSKKENLLPNKPPEQLADEFASYFLNKIEDIQK